MRRCTVCHATFRAAIAFCPRDRGRIEERLVDPLIGAVLGDRYKIVDTLGSGGMGLVYRAEHVRMPRAFAVKVLYGDLAADERMVERFRREAELMSVLNHPNIVNVADFGETSAGLLYLVMELIEGFTLQEVIRKGGPLSAGRTVGISNQIARAMTEAHARNIIHRDLKPQNVMLVDRRDAVDVAKILDFGIARMRLTEGDDALRLTTTGSFFGTPAYMAPEQLDGSDVDVRSDLYALGVMMFEMLEARVPFVGTPSQIASQRVSAPPPPPSTSDPVLREIVVKLLAKLPEDRYQSAAELLDALDEVDVPKARPRMSSGRNVPTLNPVSVPGTPPAGIPPPQPSLSPPPSSSPSLTPAGFASMEITLSVPRALRVARSVLPAIALVAAAIAIWVALPEAPPPKNDEVRRWEAEAPVPVTAAPKTVEVKPVEPQPVAPTPVVEAKPVETKPQPDPKEILKAARQRLTTKLAHKSLDESDLRYIDATRAPYEQWKKLERQQNASAAAVTVDVLVAALDPIAVDRPLLEAKLLRVREDLERRSAAAGEERLRSLESRFIDLSTRTLKSQPTALGGFAKEIEALRRDVASIAAPR